MYHWPGNCWWWRFPCPCSHTHIYIFMYILILMSNNLVNQSTKAISTNELRWIGPVLAVMSSGPMDLFLIFWSMKLGYRKLGRITLWTYECFFICNVDRILWWWTYRLVSPTRKVQGASCSKAQLLPNWSRGLQATNWPAASYSKKCSWRLVAEVSTSSYNHLPMLVVQEIQQ